MPFVLAYDNVLDPGQSTPDLDIQISSQHWVINFPDYVDLRVAKFGYFTYLRPVALPVLGSKLVVFDSIAVWNNYQYWISGTNGTGFEARFRLSSSMGQDTRVRVWRGP